MAESVDRLRMRVVELEQELARERSRRASGIGPKLESRTAIPKMSSEVVDSNPYR